MYLQEKHPEKTPLNDEQTLSAKQLMLRALAREKGK
jgi:hypothetical protein